jgi:hypothetical protein
VKHTRFTPAAVVELEDAARRVDRARPGWGDKLNDEVLEALERIEEYVEGWQTFDERGPERRFVLDRFPCFRSTTNERASASTRAPIQRFEVPCLPITRVAPRDSDSSGGTKVQRRGARQRRSFSDDRNRVSRVHATTDRGSGDRNRWVATAVPGGSRIRPPCEPRRR